MRQTGFSLVEVMIGLGLLAIGTTAFVLFSGQASQANRYAAGMSSHNDLVAEIKMALDSEEGCSGNFRTLKVPTGANEVLGVSISTTNSAGVKQREIAVAGLKYSNTISILKTDLELASILPGGQQLLRLNIATDKGETLGPRSMVTQIPLLAQVNAAGEIQSCRGAFQYTGMVNIESMICRLQSDGRYIYDPETKSCVLIPCTKGTATTATCPPGSGTLRACSASGYQIDDASRPTVERGYADGVKRSGGPSDFIAEYNADRTVCSCVYAVEVVVTADTHCEACCSPADPLE